MRKTAAVTAFLLAGSLLLFGCSTPEKVTISGTGAAAASEAAAEEYSEQEAEEPAAESGSSAEKEKQSAVASPTPTPAEKKAENAQKQAKTETKAGEQKEQEKQADPYKASSVQKAYSAAALEAEKVEAESGDAAATSSSETGAAEKQDQTGQKQPEGSSDAAASSSSEKDVPEKQDQTEQKQTGEQAEKQTEQKQTGEQTEKQTEQKQTGEQTEKQTEQDETESNSRIIMIDPGHSGAQKGEEVPIGPGASEMKDGDAAGTSGAASGLHEYDLTMQISQQLRTELQARGYTVYLTHEDNDTAINCDERATAANEAGADCFIRIHADGSEDTSAAGAMAICITASNPWTPGTYAESRRLSDCVLSAYCEATGFGSRGILEEDNMTGNNWAVMPTTLLEMGFMTNPEEDLQMADPEFQKTMVRGIANGIDAWFAG